MPFLLIAMMLLAQVRPGVVTGQILHADGTPAIGIRVAVVSERDAAANISSPETMANIASTDASGRYRLEGIEPGNYFVTAGYRVSPIYYPGVKTLADARTIRITAGITTATVDFRIPTPSPVSVSGRLNGIPAALPANLLRASLFSSTGGTLYAALRSDGTFDFPPVVPGAYTFSLVASTGIGPTRRIQVGDDRFELPDIEFQETVWGRAVIEEGGDLPLMKATVGVLQEPVRQFTFSVSYSGGLPRLRSGAGPDGGSAAVRDNGVFNFRLTKGEYKLWYLQIPIGYAVKSMSYGSVDLLKGDSFTIVDPTVPGEMRVVLTRNLPTTGPSRRKISGRVQGLEGTAGPAWVWLRSKVEADAQDVRWIGEVEVRADGTFELAEVPPGNYSLQVRERPASNGPPVGVEVRDSDITGLVLLPAPPR